MTFNQAIGEALDQYFAPERPTLLPPVMAERLDGLVGEIRQVAQRLAQIEALTQQTAELLALLAESSLKTPAVAEASAAEATHTSDWATHVYPELRDDPQEPERLPAPDVAPPVKRVRWWGGRRP